MCFQNERAAESDLSVALEEGTIHIESNSKVPVDSKQARSALAMRVYCVYVLQTLVAFLVALSLRCNDPRFFMQMEQVMNVAAVTFIVIQLMTNCSKSVRDTYPLNIVLLIVSTGARAIGGGIITYLTGPAAPVGAGAVECLIVLIMAKFSPNEIKCSCVACVVAFVHQTNSTLLIFLALSYLVNSIVILVLGGIALVITLRILFGPSLQCEMDLSDSLLGQCFSPCIGFKNKIFSYSVCKGKSHEENKSNGVDQMV